MYGLPSDTDLFFLCGAQLIEVCTGENETTLPLHPACHCIRAVHS